MDKAVLVVRRLQQLRCHWHQAAEAIVQHSGLFHQRAEDTQRLWTRPILFDLSLEKDIHVTLHLDIFLCFCHLHARLVL